MAQARALPYGSWPSPVSIEMATGANLSLREPRFDGADILWTEGRPEERGRQVIVRRAPDGRTADLTPAPYNARTMVNEYGGGWYAPMGGVVYFSNVEDGRIYRVQDGGVPQPVTAAGELRYGDLTSDATRGRLLCVVEDHTELQTGGDRVPEPRDYLAAVAVDDGTVTVLAQGNDFYSTPRPSPDGRRLAWLAWNHPNMPWDGSELWLADVDDDGSLRSPRVIAGGPSESIVQPEWAPDGTLVFVSDRTGWWNLYRWSDAAEATAIWPLEAELAGPQWVFGMTWYGIADDGTIVATVKREGRDELWHIPLAGEPAQLDVPDDQISATLSVSGRRALYVAARSDEPAALVVLDLDSGRREVVRRSFELEVDRAYLSRPEPIEFPTSDGDSAYAIFYPPTNPGVRGPDDERPPLVVMSHGGPTSSAGHALDLEKQVFTSRGFAVVDVDYRGSSGYGRAYRRKLDGKWGVYDVDDCVAAARFLAERGDVDPARMAIRGGSAGGYTTLCALTFHDVFAAGASYYGVGDLEALARDTHKFESRYIDGLVAPYPERMDVFHERSPIRSVERLSSPLIVLQGTDDKVVPLAQAEQIVAALREQKIAHAYLPFEGEGHGFRQAANIRRALEAELSFYAQVFGFTLADDIEPVEVAYLNG